MEALHKRRIRNFESGSVPAIVLSVVSTTCCTTMFCLFLAYVLRGASSRPHKRALAGYRIRGVTIPRHDNFLWQWETPLYDATSADGYPFVSQNLIYSFAVLVCFSILFVKHEIIWVFSTMPISLTKLINLVAGHMSPIGQIATSSIPSQWASEIRVNVQQGVS
jgi:hypothetical protein